MYKVYNKEKVINNVLASTLMHFKTKRNSKSVNWSYQNNWSKSANEIGWIMRSNLVERDIFGYFSSDRGIHTHYLGPVNCYSWLACIWWWTYLIRAYLMIRTISSLACIHIYTMSHESRLLYSFADMWVLTNNIWWAVICFHIWLSSMQILIILRGPFPGTLSKLLSFRVRFQ